MLPTMRLGFDTGMLAKKVFLFHRRNTGVRVGTTDHAELEGVHAKFLFQLQAGLKGFARVFVLQHFGLLCLGAVQVRSVPCFEVCELVIRRKHRMRLAVPLDLGHLDNWFQAGAQFSKFPVQRFACKSLD